MEVAGLSRIRYWYYVFTYTSSGKMCIQGGKDYCSVAIFDDYTT